MLVSWSLQTDEDGAVELDHDDGYRLAARATESTDGDPAWLFEVRDTVTGQELVRQLRPVSDDERLWAILDEYAGRYPPERPE